MRCGSGFGRKGTGDGVRLSMHPEIQCSAQINGRLSSCYEFGNLIIVTEWNTVCKGGLRSERI